MATLFIGESHLIQAGRIKPPQCVRAQELSIGLLQEMIERNDLFDRIVTFISSDFKKKNPWVNTLLSLGCQNQESGRGAGFKLGVGDLMIDISSSAKTPSGFEAFSLASAEEISITIKINP
ncbi:MAG: hypothetical protein WCV55_03455 [Candidatus Paceibacterota bacterium]